MILRALLLAMILADSLPAQEALSPLVSASPAPARTPSSPGTSSHVFSSKTVWGRLKVQVWEKDGKFKVEAVGDNAISGWSFMEDASRKTLARGAMAPATTLRFEVSQAFQGPYRLTVFFLDGREEVPVSLRISPGADPSGKASANGPVEEFKADSDRPFNSMVKSLYEKAADQWTKGNPAGAEKSLAKAQEMDPEQPQVLALLSRIREETGLSKLPVQTREPGPKDTPDRKKKRASFKRKPTPIPPPPGPAENSLDRAAKADRAYTLGLESYRQKDLPAAKKFWEETLLIDPTHAQAKRNLERLKKDHPKLP